MHTIGIDMSKDSFHAAFDGATVEKFPNTTEGIRAFLHALHARRIEEDCTIGVEATGAYHLPFCAQCAGERRRVMVINPLVAHRAISSTLRRVKTDRHDALAIRSLAATGAGYPFTDTPDTLALKTLVTERAALVGMQRTIAQRLHVHAYKARAASLPLYDCFSAPSLAITKEIRAMEKQMRRYHRETQKLLSSIPGIGEISSAALVAMVGDISRFPSPEKLVAYIGLDCRVYESGVSVRDKGYMTKRGNAYLRHTLFNAAFVAVRHQPALGAYFRKKRGEGKHYFSALCAVERKLVHQIYAVWKRGTPFVP